MLAGLWLVGWAWLTVIGGERVPVTVLAHEPDGQCRVSWVTSAGEPGAASVDCADEPLGAHREVWAHPWPLRGEAVDVAWTAWGVTLVAAALFGMAGYGAWRGGSGSDREDVAVALDPPPLPAGPLDVAEVLRRHDEPAGSLLVRLAPYATAQLPGHGWEDPRRPEGARPARGLAPVLRALAAPAVGLALVLLLTAPWPYRAWVLHRSATAVATAVSTGEVAIDGPGPVPEDVTVLVELPDGRRQRADVAVNGALPEGSRVSVRYAVDRPQWVRLDGDGDGLRRGVVLAGLGCLLAAGAAGWRVVGVRVERGAVSAALHGRQRPVTAVLTADPEDEPLLLVADEGLLPARLLAVPVQVPLPAGCAASFAAGPVPGTALGQLADDQPVALQLAGLDGPLLPSGPAWEPGSEELADLLDTPGALSRAYDRPDEYPQAARHTQVPATGDRP